MSKPISNQPLTIEQQDWQRFLTRDGLSEKAGCAPDQFHKMVVKEFADNAADIGGFRYEIDHGNNTLSIINSGAGLSTEEIKKYFSIKRPLRSSKHWRRGERGALGNGIRAALAGCRLCNIQLEVTSQRLSHAISLGDDGEVSISTCDANEAETIVKLTFNQGISAPDFADHLRLLGKTVEQKVTSGKPMPSWFKAEDLNAIVQSLDDGFKLRDFASQFDVKVPETGLDRDIPVCTMPISKVRDLLIGQEKNSKIYPLGKNTFPGDYKKVAGIFNDAEASLPFIVEAWAEAHASTRDNDQHSITVLTNRTEMLGEARLRVTSGRVVFEDSELRTGNRSSQLNRSKRFEVLLAISTPRIPILSSGKMPALVRTYGEEILDAIIPAMKAASRIKTKTPGAWDLKTAAFHCMEDAYNRVSSGGKYWANARQLMYAARPEILRLSRKEKFDDKTFTQSWLPDFLNYHPLPTDHWKIAYDKRGELITPHTRSKVGLGTVEVDRLSRHISIRELEKMSDFRFSDASPENRFSSVLYVEKEGFNQAISDSGLLEKYDVALASTKGMSTIAMRALLDEMVTRNPNFKIFTMTDFDITGTSIKATLTKDNDRRFVFKNNIATIPVCVTWPQAEELHKKGFSEPVVLPKTLNTYRKADFLMRENDVPVDGVRFLLEQEKRVEINALSTEEILNLIESAFERNCTKVIPDEAHLNSAWREQLLAARLEKAESEIRLETDSAQYPQDLMQSVKGIMADDASLSWDQAVRNIAGKTLL